MNPGFLRSSVPRTIAGILVWDGLLEAGWGLFTMEGGYDARGSRVDSKVARSDQLSDRVLRGSQVPIIRPVKPGCQAICISGSTPSVRKLVHFPPRPVGQPTTGETNTTFHLTIRKDVLRGGRVSNDKSPAVVVFRTNLYIHPSRCQI